MSSPEQPASAAKERKTGSAGKQPLYLRLYFQTHLTEIVRAIAYGDVPVDEARKRIEPLIKKFGKEKIMQGCQELVDVTAGPDFAFARLKVDVRKLAFQILGPPPDPSSPKAPAPASGAENAATETALSTVKMPRYHVMKKFEEHLIAAKQQYTTHAELLKSMPFLDLLPALDYLVVREQSRLLVTVRPNLRGNQGAQMIACSDALATNHTAVRVWPAEGSDQWMWQEHELIAEPLGIDPKRHKLSLDDWRAVHVHCEGDKKCGRNWLKEGCACAVCKAARAIFSGRTAKRRSRP